MGWGDGMTDETRDQLRAHGAQMFDEARRFQYLIERKYPDEAIVAMHLANVLKFAKLCDLAMHPPVPVQYSPVSETRGDGNAATWTIGSGESVSLTAVSANQNIDVSKDITLGRKARRGKGGTDAEV